MKPSFLAIAFTIAVALTSPAHAAVDDRTVPLADVLDLDATVTSEVAPDLAVVTLAIVREGPDVAPLTKDVNEAMARAFADARTVPAVTAANGGYSTFPRFDSRGGSNTRTGWQVRAEVVLKSKDFDALGILVGRLSQSLQISGSSFEISPEVRARESASLTERGARAFLDKAQATTRAFGYAGYSIRHVTVGSPDLGRAPRVQFAEAAVMAKSVAPMPIESGRVTLSLTVSGSVQMRK